MSKDTEMNGLLKDLSGRPSYSHNLFKRVIKKKYEGLPLEQFFDEFAQYLVVLSRKPQENGR